MRFSACERPSEHSEHWFGQLGSWRMLFSTTLLVELGISNLSITKSLRLPKAQSLGLVLDLLMPQSQWLFSPISEYPRMGGYSFLLVTPCKSQASASLAAPLRAEAGNDDSTEHTPACHQPRKPKQINPSDPSGSLQHRNETPCWLITPLADWGRISKPGQAFQQPSPSHRAPCQERYGRA